MRGSIAVLLVALAATAGAGAQPFSGGPHPTTVANSYTATGGADFAGMVLSWESPESFAQAEEDFERPYIVERGGTLFCAPSTCGVLGLVVRRTFPALPDGGSFGDSWYIDSVLARARAGRRALLPAMVDGQAAWRTSFETGPRRGDCSFGWSRQTVWLSRETLLPLLERGHSRIESWRYVWAYSNVNDDIPDSAFGRPFMGERPRRRDEGFRRTSPTDAATHLSYRPLLPIVLPSGFALAVSGWAPRSGVTGAEGAMPARPELFTAVYRRGFERIDVTQRLSGPRGWLADPFGSECAWQYREPATVRGVRGWYGIGLGITPHLYWRQGRLLFTVSGPFPKRDLVAIANSLTPVP